MTPILYKKLVGVEWRHWFPVCAKRKDGNWLRGIRAITDGLRATACEASCSERQLHLVTPILYKKLVGVEWRHWFPVCAKRKDGNWLRGIRAITDGLRATACEASCSERQLHLVTPILYKKLVGVEWRHWFPVCAKRKDGNWLRGIRAITDGLRATTCEASCSERQLHLVTPIYTKNSS